MIDLQFRRITAKTSATAQQLHPQVPAWSRKGCRLRLANNRSGRPSPRAWRFALVRSVFPIRVLRRSAWRHEQPHTGPGGLTAYSERPDQKTQASAGFGGQLQTTKRVAIQFPGPSHHGRNVLAPQNLIQRPVFVLVVLRSHDNRALQVNLPGSRSGWVERAVTIHNHQNAALPTCFATGNQRQRAGSTARTFRKPFHQRSAGKTSLGKQLIKWRTTAANSLLFGSLPGAIQPLQKTVHSLHRLADRSIFLNGHGTSPGIQAWREVSSRHHRVSSFGERNHARHRSVGNASLPEFPCLHEKIVYTCINVHLSPNENFEILFCEESFLGLTPKATCWRRFAANECAQASCRMNPLHDPKRRSREST